MGKSVKANDKHSSAKKQEWKNLRQVRRGRRVGELDTSCKGERYE